MKERVAVLSKSRSTQEPEMFLDTVATAFVFALSLTEAVGEDPAQTPQSSSGDESSRDFKFSLNTTWHSFLNFGEEKTNTHHYELHFRTKVAQKDKVGIKLATWKMFAPMGMPMQEQLKFDESNFYPGRVGETGIGLTYQRMIWKGLFAAIEMLPQLKTYNDENGKRIGNGFKLYTSYHLGYHFTLLRNRVFIDPQIHCQYWPIDTNTPAAFGAKESKWKNYFLFEPNLYIGVNFQ